MRRQIAAANWKMNMTFQQAEKLLDDILTANINLSLHQQVIYAVPFPYLIMTRSEVSEEFNHYAAAQNCSDKKSGAYTGEISAEILHSVRVDYCIIGHSERREYFQESNAVLAEKVNRCLENSIMPIFCCGESLPTRDAGMQNEFVATQLQESLFHLTADEFRKVIIAYEPIWAIGTGKTATTQQAQEMHAYLRSVVSAKYGETLANEIPILYGGSVKANNASELFGCPDVDGGLVGGASLIAADFIDIIRSLKE